MAFAAQYMDHSWGKHRYWVGNENPHPPSYYMDQNIWGSFLRDRIGIEIRITSYNVCYTKLLRG